MRTLDSNHRRFLVTGALVVFLILSLGSCDTVKVSTWYEQGALATAAPLATDIGLQVLAEGGNAFDAAVAVGFALAVVHPEAGNIGGGGFALVREGAGNKIRSLDFRETAPRAASEGMYLDEDSSVIDGASTVGALASGVPGTVAGLHRLWQAYGSLAWEDLVTPAVALADTGFIVDEYLAASFAEYGTALQQFEETRSVFFSEGKRLEAGDRLVQKDLGATLHLISVAGPDGFYGGETADLIVATMEKYGGLITRADLDSYEAIWREPVHFTFDSLDIYSMAPPSSGGLIMGQILGLLEPFPFAPYTADSPEYIHLFVEAARLAFADRAEHLGDPAFWDIPQGLLDSAYLARRRALIDQTHAVGSEAVRPGSPQQGESEQTTHYSICDADGNMVAVTYTLNTGYGSKLMVGGAGFLLNNEMDDFVAKPGVPNTYGLVGGEANKVEPGKRMLSSMTPTLILKEGKPYLAIGSPGGSKIITAVAQAIINFTRFDMGLADAVAQPRFHHQWLPDVLYYEQGGYDITVVQDLIRRGHHVMDREAYGDVQAVHVNDAGLMTAVSDPRKRGTGGGL